MRVKTQLALLQQMRQRHNLARQAFTLVELMIVVAIIGLLSAVALPQFLNARDRADAKAKVGEAVGLAKECAVFNAEADSAASGVRVPGASTTTIACGGATIAAHTIASREFNSTMAVECLGVSLPTSTKAVQIVISIGGQMTCTGLAAAGTSA